MYRKKQSVLGIYCESWNVSPWIRGRTTVHALLNLILATTLLSKCFYYSILHLEKLRQKEAILFMQNYNIGNGSTRNCTQAFCSISNAFSHHAALIC